MLTLAAAAVVIIAQSALHATPARAGDSVPAVTARACGWVVPWDNTLSSQSLTANVKLIGETSPFWFDMTAKGNLSELAGSGDAALLAAVTAGGANTLPTITNHFDGKRAHRMLRSDATRTAHATAIADLVAARDYDGIDIDYENLRPADRARFTAFATTLATKLHGQGKLLSLTLMSRTATVAYSGASAENYAALGLVADRIRVMAYDYHYAGSRPGPVAPMPWVREVVSYAASQVDPAKLELGAPLYGFMWTRGQRLATSVTYVKARALARAQSARIHFHATYQEPYAHWHRKHHPRVEMWFEDGRAIDAKLALADEFHLAGVCMWRLGGEDPDVWKRVAARWGTPT